MRTCSKCTKKHYAKGFCEAHYKEDRELKKPTGKLCSINGCDGFHYGLDLCRKHYKTEYKRKWRNRVRHTSEYKLEKNLRNRHNQALKGARKLSHPIKHLGCTIEQLKQHIESLFEPGMDWGNRGLGPDKWQIDHIIPFSSINLLDEHEQLMVCHYTNLRPIWSEEHNIKSSNERWLK
jgi:hypothetical protein